MTGERFTAHPWPWVFGILGVFAALQAYYNTTLPLSGDEAYYWVWAKNLQAGYFDHPPGIAALIALSTRLFGDNIFAVRLVAVLCMAGAIFFIHRTALEVMGEGAAWLAFALALVLPAMAAGFTLATPDSPLILCWSAGLYFGRRAVAGPGRWSDFLLMGVAVGAGMASKYTAVLLPAAIAIFVIVRRTRLVVSPKAWVAALAALAVFAPVVWWNWQHGFESFLFQYRHGGAKAQSVQWKWLLEFLGGQALIITPILLVLLLARIGAWRDWLKDDKRLFLMLCFLVPASVFTYKSAFAKIQLNWALPIYVSAIPLVADYMVSRRLKRVTAAAFVLAVLMAAAIKWPLAFGLSGKLNPHNRLHGPEQAAAALQQLRRDDDTIFADHLQRASLLRFYLPGHPRVYIPVGTRFSEYSRWDQGTDFARMHGLVLSESNREAELKQVFGQAELVQEVVAEAKGFRTERYFIYRVGQS